MAGTPCWSRERTSRVKTYELTVMLIPCPPDSGEGGRRVENAVEPEKKGVAGGRWFYVCFLGLITIPICY